MCTAFRNASVLNDQDLICIADSRQTMRDGDDGMLACNPGDCALDLALGFNVNECCSLIQNNDGRFAKNRPGNRDSLLLATGQAKTSFTDLGLILRINQGKCVRSVRKLRLPVRDFSDIIILRHMIWIEIN